MIHGREATVTKGRTMAQAWAILAVIGGLLAAPMALAQPRFAPPSGCTLTMTVQMRSCQVANYYTCAGDAAGDRRVSFADGEGEYFVSHIDAETRWIENVSLATGETERLDPAASQDNASFSALLDTGRDDYDFVTRSDGGLVQRFIGHDALTGESTRVDGVTLEYCTFEMRIEDTEGGLLGLRKGRQLISREKRLFFGDVESFENSYGDASSSHETPMSFAFPGEKGFGAATPEYDCDMMMTDLSPLLDHPSKEALR